MDWHKFLDKVGLILSRSITDNELTYIRRCYKLGLTAHDTAFVITGET